jgi:hypothetical protein
MRTETRTVQIGENMGPIDWSYDFRSHFASYITPDICVARIAWLRRVEHDFRAGVPIRVTNDGGSPRCGIYPVIDVGMYDGWPHWKPVPSICVATHMGSTWYGFYSITNVYPGERGLEALR